MEEIIARIKGYVLVIYPTILADLSMTDAQLDFVIADVVDRVLAYTNRQQLVEQYEEDLLDVNVDEEDYVLPIPREIERGLAKTVVSSMKTLNSNNTAENGVITQLSDNGQSISYSDKVASFFNSSDDSEIFSGMLGVLERYILPNIPNNDNTNQFYDSYWR